jgi:hypothetical protein
MNCSTCKGGLPLVRFSSLTDTRPAPDQAPWVATRALLLTSTELPEKGGPLWSPVTYKPGATRLLSGVESVHAFVADVDDGVSPDVIEAHLKKLGVEFVIHSTHSSTPDHPKFRVVVPLAGAVAAAAWPGVWPVLNEQLVLSHSDPATKDASRAFYWPTHPSGSEPFQRSAHGKPAQPPLVAPPPPRTSSPLPVQDVDVVRSAAELLARVEGQSADGPVLRRLLETTRGEPRSHQANLLLCAELYRASATVPQISQFLEWPPANVQSTLKGFRTKGAYSIQLGKLAKEDPLVADAIAACRSLRAEGPRNPWEGRGGWEEELLLPILYGDSDEGKIDADDSEDESLEAGSPIEPVYVLYNRLIGSFYFRPFRTTAGGPRVAIPTECGLEVLNPADKNFGDRIGYQLFAKRGLRVPFKRLGIVARTLTSRALDRALPLDRVVDLSLRCAPSGPYAARLDMADDRRRCIAVGADGWKLEEVGHPTFDTVSHQRPLPSPARAPGADGDWTRVGRLWKYIPLPNGGVSGNQRLLALADLVQFVLAPRTRKTVKILAKDEGAGKSSMMARYQAVLDPSNVPHMGPPRPNDDDGAMNIAVNHSVVNLDNVTSIPLELSDYICRISSGTGLVKRANYTDRDEFVITVWRSVLINGITAVPKFHDLLRRCLFFNPARVTPLPEEFLDAEWKKDHPEILGGLLDLCVLAARELRDSPLRSQGSDMADYARIGRAVAVACGLGIEAFDAAWEINRASQDDASSQDPYVIALQEFFGARHPGDQPVRSEDIASWISTSRPQLFPKGVTAQGVGNAIGRSRRVLSRRGVRLGRQKDHGQPVWYLLAADELDPEEQIADFSVWGSPGSPGSPAGSLSSTPRQDDRGGLLSLEPDRGNLGDPPGSPGSPQIGGGSPQVPPRFPRSRPSGDNSPGEPGQPLSLQSRTEREGRRGSGPVPTALEEESNLGVTRGDRLRAQLGPLPAEAAPDYAYTPDGRVLLRLTGETVWKPGDDPATCPLPWLARSIAARKPEKTEPAGKGAAP